MKLTYDFDSDVLCLLLREEPPVDAVEEPEGVIISYGEDSAPVSVEFLDAAMRKLISTEEMTVTLQTHLSKADIK